MSQVPETTDVAFVCTDLPYFPVFTDVSDHVLSFFKRMIDCFSARRFERWYILHMRKFIAHFTDLKFSRMISTCNQHFNNGGSTSVLRIVSCENHFTEVVLY